MTAYLAEFTETISSIICDCLEGSQQPTTEEAYKKISLRTLEVFGKELIENYQEVIKTYNENKGD